MEFFYVGIRGLHCYVVKLRLTLFIRSVGPCGGYVVYFVYLSITALVAPNSLILEDTSIPADVCLIKG